MQQPVSTEVIRLVMLAVHNSPSSVCVTAFSSGMKAGAKMTGYTMFLNFTSIPKSTDDSESEAVTDTNDWLTDR